MPTLRPWLAAVVLFAAFTGLVVVAPVEAQQAKDKAPELTNNKALAAKLEAIRTEHKLPAVWGAIVRDNELLAVAAVGVRKDGDATPVTVNDQIHLGSDTKAMTATVIALLVEKKKLRWNSTIGEVFPNLKGKVHDDYLGVTVTQLLGHQAGLPANSAWGRTPPKKTNREYRRELLPTILKDAPADKPGTKFSYSNSGYVVAGAMAEEASGESWEDLMTKTLFKPLGMAKAGFGAPGAPGKVDQPWGHRLANDKLIASQTDNPPVMGPAGTAHAPLADWAKFATLHLDGARGKGTLLKPETFKHLHTPLDGSIYACGWGTGRNGVLAHDGSNTMWYARVTLFPRDNVAYLIGINQGGDEARKACDKAHKAVNDFFLAEFANKK